MKILIYRRSSDKQSFLEAEVDKHFRVSQTIGDYVYLKNQQDKDKEYQVYITQEALVHMPPKRLKLIEQLFGKVKVNGEKYSVEKNKPHVYGRNPKLTPEQLIAKRAEAAAKSKILKEGK